MRPALLVAIVSLAGVLVTRLPTRSEHLFSWDSVNFALAMQEIDLDRHQPHPPGYFGYVVAARALRFGASENAALVRVNILTAAATLLMLWWLVLRVTRSPHAAAVSWSLLLTSPLHWFYTGVTEIYALETLVTLAVAAAAFECIQRPEDRRAPWVLGGAMGLAAFCKLPASVLMAPVVVYAAARGTRATRWMIIGASAAGTLAALAAIGSLTRLESVWQLSGSQFESVSVTSVFGGIRLRALNRTARDVLYALIAAAGAGGVAAFSLRRGHLSDRPKAFLAMWAVPYVAMCLLVHFAKPGYALPLLPPLALWIAAGFTRASVRRTIVALVVIASLNAAQFAVAHPWTAERTGGGRRYAEKTTAQKARTELNSILRPSLHTIREHDSRVTEFLQSAAGCGNAATAALVWPDAPVSWRHAMFYLPDATVIQVPDERAGWLIARHRRLEDATSGDILVRADCTVLAREHDVQWTRDAFDLRSDRDGRLLQVRPRP